MKTKTAPTAYFICNPGSRINDLCADFLPAEDFCVTLTIFKPRRRGFEKHETVQGWRTTLEGVRTILKKARERGFDPEFKIAHQGGDGFLYWTPRNQYDKAARHRAANVGRVRQQIKKRNKPLVRGRVGIVK